MAVTIASTLFIVIPEVMRTRLPIHWFGTQNVACKVAFASGTVGVAEMVKVFVPVMLTTVTGVKLTPPFKTNAPVERTEVDMFVVEVIASFIPGARLVNGYPVTVTTFPELLAVAAKEKVAVVPAPVKTFDIVSVVPEIELIVVPAGKVVFPRVIAAVMPGKMPFIEPVMTTVLTPLEMVVPVMPAIAPKENVPVVPEPPKTLDNVSTAPAIELTIVPSAKVPVPAVTITDIPGVIPFIEPVIVRAAAATANVPVTPVKGGISQLLVTSWSWVIS